MSVSRDVSKKRKFGSKQYFESKSGYSKSSAIAYAKKLSKVYKHRLVKKKDGYSVYLRTRGI